MADYIKRCVMLAVRLLVLGCTSIQSASVNNMTERCLVGQVLQQLSDPGLICIITSTNINDILYEIKHSQLSILGLDVVPQLQFGESVFNPNLHYLGIAGSSVSISPGTFRGLNSLRGLLISGKYLYGAFHNTQMKADVEEYGNNKSTYPLNISYRSPVFGENWLSPLKNLQLLNIAVSNISSFRVEEFCTLNKAITLQLAGTKINSTEGLGITCNSSSCIPCLPTVKSLDISYNPISEFNIDISTNLPNLIKFYISHCNLSELYFNHATSENMTKLSVDNNILQSLLIIEEVPCIRPHLRVLLLQNNKLRTISPGLFLCMPQLGLLYLSGNALTEETLIRAHLNSLIVLKYLDLSHNNIKKLQPALIGNMTELRQLWCTACNLTTIDPNTFIHIRNLNDLRLNNNYLFMIEAGTFSHFLSLKQLDISQNALNEIPLTENLISLTDLDLSENLLSEIPDFSSSQFNLSTLRMDRNQITHLSSKLISGLTNLKYLSLSFNNIESIPNYTFANQNILATLILSSNKIKTISKLGLSRLPNLTDLSLDNNFLMELPPMQSTNLNNMTYLNLSGNLIETMNLEYGQLLEGIDLSHNHISQIKFNLHLFKNLQYVNYSNNHISTLDRMFFLTRTSPRPQVYLQGNPLHVDCHSEWLLDAERDKSVTASKIKSWRGITVQVLPLGNSNRDDHYVYVKIADWDLLYGTTATGINKSFSEISSADFLCQYREMFCIPDCPEHCCQDNTSTSCPCTFCYPECTCYAGYRINFMNCSSRNMTILPSKGPLYVKSIILDGNYLTSMNSSSLNFPYLTKLNAANSHILHLQPKAFSNLKRLRILHLQDNIIEMISKQTFKLLIKLEELYLQYNNIYQINNGSFDNLHQLKTLWLHGNKLKYLQLSLFERLHSLGELTLHDNPWSCDCTYGPVIQELLTHSEAVVDRLQIYCNITEPTGTAYNTGLDSSQYNLTNSSSSIALSMHSQAVISIDFSVCINRTVIERVYARTVLQRVYSKSITEVVSLAVVVAILAILILVIIKTRLLIRVWFYNKFGIRFHQKEEVNDDRPYDLFIAYDKTDERLVINEILPKLEQGVISYKVCLDCRDWLPGAPTIESVVASVQLSKRTIVLVSPNHLDTQWCEYSFDAAHYQVLKDKHIQLILVLTNLELQARMTRAMKLYMKTNPFLVIGEKWFWKKLRYYLADNPRGADYIVGREFRMMNEY